MAGVSLELLIRTTVGSFDVDPRRTPPMFGLVQEGVVRNALSDVSEKMVETIGKNEARFAMRRGTSGRRHSFQKTADQGRMAPHGWW